MWYIHGFLKGLGSLKLNIDYSRDKYGFIFINVATSMLSQKDRALPLNPDNLFEETLKYIESLKGEQSLAVPSAGNHSFEAVGTVDL